jgi:multimeric flavodoxin WrbA
MKLLGISASLRNARWGIGSQKLITLLQSIASESELFEFLSQQAELHLENFVESGRAEGLSFLEIYGNLKKSKGEQGLSNTEVALAAGLWSAAQYGIDIEHLSLSEYFPASGKERNLDQLRQHLRECDGILLSGPVYFGDRGSLAQSLIELIRRDEILQRALQGKLYAGIAVGAKRNGGQETNLIYQMWDFLNLGFLAVGNDSDTTSQYGGTGHAGDVGTMSRDHYGLQTSMGTGRRIGSILRDLSAEGTLTNPVKLLFLVLQDSNGQVVTWLKEFLEPYQSNVQVTVVNLTQKSVQRCLACDFCPTHIDVDEVYRCIIKSKNDDLEAIHPLLLQHDAIVPVILSPQHSQPVQSVYQTFMERTRYLRRGDYVFSNLMVAPLVLEEIGVNDNYGMRMMTSMLRHHTILSQPLIGSLYQGKLLNQDILRRQFQEFILAVRRVTFARLSQASQSTELGHAYNPIGYIISLEKEKEAQTFTQRDKLHETRQKRLFQEAQNRLGS